MYIYVHIYSYIYTYIYIYPYTGYTLDQELEKKINAEIKKDETNRENQINSQALKKKVMVKPQEVELNCNGDVDPFIGIYIYIHTQDIHWIKN
jgi:hypothetical protein